ncbi:MAG: SMP-30/gluconolactonase/LRE family protein [Pseudomonadota bacterium]
MTRAATASATAEIYDPTPCVLGEGPLWHPGRGQLFWFDILARRVLTREGGHTRHWQFTEYVSAAGWVSDTELMIASASRLMLFDLETGRSRDIHPLEADNPVTRSNDGRADPWGGFWIGTMGIGAEPGAGAISRYYRGDLRTLHGAITIPNAICFAPDRSVAYFTDTPTGIIRRQRLDPETGWPATEAEPHIDLTAEGLAPDGAVVDADGILWSAQWGAGRVAAYNPEGRFLRAVAVPATQATCPAFGGPTLDTLFVTSAADGLSRETRAAEPTHGATFAIPHVATGQPEHQVLI